MKRLDQYWQQKHPIVLLLLPVSWLYCALVWVRRQLYQLGLLQSHRLPVPVIVVGNITVGGTGKTPLVIALLRVLQEKGYRPGIVSRGYGGQARHWPQQVRPDSDPRMVGDEPVLLARHCRVPVAVGPDRVAAAQALLQFNDCNLIISDDGLQHYAMDRDIDIAVVDGDRRFGNGYCLPAGPLREPRRRLREMDFVVTNGIALRGEFPMQMQTGTITNLRTGAAADWEDFRDTEIQALAGIGNPERFFQALRQQGLQIVPHVFPDHHPFTGDETVFSLDTPVFMTEKDAVKCRDFARDNFWYVPVRAVLDERLVLRLTYTLERLNR